ncbi:MAG: PP2C family protein-serine/threonine phosphatase [Bacteroidia bacterium]
MKGLFLYKKIIALLFILAAFNIYAVPDSLIFRIKSGGGISINSNGVSIRMNTSAENEEYWFYNPSDRYVFALKDYDDSKWKLFSPDMVFENDSVFKGLGWFRLHYKIEQKDIGKPFMLSFTHLGASEIFNDGKLLDVFGVVSAKGPDEEISMDPSEKYLPIAVADTLEHVIAVRFSNQHAGIYFEKFENPDSGFRMSVFRGEELPRLQQMKQISRMVFVGLSMFLLALSLVHLMIFLFERSRRFNLYHSIFVLSLSFVFLVPVLRNYTSSVIWNLRLEHYSEVLVPTFFFFIMILLYNLFEKKFNRFFYIFAGVYILSIITRYFISRDFAGIFYITLIFMTYFSSLIISIKAIRQNFRGAKIVGVGVLAVTVFFILSIVSGIVFKNSALFVIPCLILCILSLPFSMSIYLAFDFAKANETLKTQIVQIQDLSEKALHEEAEKKQILENQNQMLETQVKERTAEITAQKEIIEEKNKDITDSINYAKRIQDATLVSKEIKYRLFPNAFVLFKPKDIVSGDFYWFAGKDGRRLISVCDCTGHGVPGALMSMIGNNLLNKVVNEKAITAPDQILIELDKELRLTLKKDENPSAKDGMDVALLSFKSESEMEYAGANRPLWIIRNGQLEEIKATKISIGGDRYGADIQFKNHEVQLQKGDTVYISSDGFADQFNNADKKLMTRRFKEILLSIQHLEMAEQEKYLDEFIEKWKGGLEQTDDILVIGIRV